MSCSAYMLTLLIDRLQDLLEFCWDVLCRFDNSNCLFRPIHLH